MIAGWCCCGMQHEISGNDAALMGLLGCLAGTLGDGAIGTFRFGILGVGSSTLGVCSCHGAILSNIAANYFIACILILVA
jgi:hypothetical protein